MLMVMLILLVATASAAVSVHSVQTELRAAGHNRQAIQTQYASEAALMTSIAWIDMASSSGNLTALANSQNALPITGLRMFRFAQPEYETAKMRMNAMFLSSQQQANNRQVDEVQAMNAPQNPAAGSGGSGGSGGIAALAPDLIGSFGPQQAYQPDPNWQVHVNDCQDAAAGGTEAGSIAAGVSSSTEGGTPKEWFCVVTSYGRTVLSGYGDPLNPVTTPGEDGHNWTIGANIYQSSKYSAAHDSRALIRTVF